jgi:DNA polymerase elongation subunit (family B)
MDAQPVNLSDLVHSAVDRLVAAEPGTHGTAALYLRSEPARVERREVPFHPWLLVSGEALAATPAAVSEKVVLAGPGMHNVRLHFADFSACQKAAEALKKLSGARASSPQAPYRLFPDLTQQLLTTLPARLFRGLAFADLVRLQVDIETLTTPGFDFPNAERDGDQIVMIALRDSRGWEHLLSGPETGEADLLRELVRLIRERDPDVIEGHNLFGFDLPYIDTRARRHGVRLTLGRDGSRMTARSSRFSAGEHTSSYSRYEVYGRHLVDTLHLVQLYDVSHRDMDSYGLKACARYFGVAAPDRTYVDGGSISAVYRSDPARLRAYAMDDVRETDAVSRILLPSHFHQAQLVPFSLQNCVTRGNATRIDALLCGEYMVAGVSLPTPQAPREFQGGLTESLASGVFENVWHVDVRSLYPSLIISRGLTPRLDTLGAYQRLLRDLRRFRLAAKDAARAAAADQREDLEALQSSFKVLINSFYGYAGFPQGTFNDYDLAETVTAAGRHILQSMQEFLLSRQATVIEMDTDGIYFVPPVGQPDPAPLAAALQAILPEGIDVDLDASYKAMFGYKAKNYALLGHDGSVSLTGAALKSRGLEPFQRRYIRDLLTLLLTQQGAAAAALYARCQEALKTHALPLSDLAKREVLSSPPKVYAEELKSGGRRSAAYELVLQSGRDYRQGDAVVFYVTGERKNVAVTDAAKLLGAAVEGVRDENVPYYLDKLAKLHAKFAEFLPA